MFRNIIKEGAVFIADSHYSNKRREFLDFLNLINKGKIRAKQLFLLGDNFDLLFGETQKIISLNQEAINLLNEISFKIEVFYFEGNHDFNLKDIFKNIKIFSYKEQPSLFCLGEYRVLISHGDIRTGDLFYDLYTCFIRNIYILKFFNYLDLKFNNFITNFLLNKVDNKNLCNEISDFEVYIKNRVKKFQDFDYDIFLEGHYHQGDVFDFDKLRYINISSFACSKSFFIVKSLNNRDFFSSFKLKEFF